MKLIKVLFWLYALGYTGIIALSSLVVVLDTGNWSIYSLDGPRFYLMVPVILALILVNPFKKAK